MAATTSSPASLALSSIVTLFWGLLLSSTILRGQTATILFTGSANGVIQNCYCPDARLGGLEKRAQFIATYRAQHPDVLVLDNGDNFIEYLTPGFADVVTAAMQLMKVDVINLGDQDIAYGDQAYFELGAVVPDLGRAVTIDRGSTHFSILPVLSAAATKFYPEFVFADLDLNRLDAQIMAWLAAELPDNAYRILLSHSGLEADKALARTYPGIDLIVGGHSQTVLDTPVVVNGVHIVQAGGYAGYVGEIRLDAGPGGFVISGYQLHPLTQALPDHPGVMKLIDRFTASR